MNIRVTTPRDITMGDLTAVQKVYRDAYRLHETEPAAMQMVFELGQADAIQLCSDHSGALLAVASYTNRDLSGGVIEITRMATRRMRQGSGIGRLMLANFIAGRAEQDLILAAQSRNPAFPALLEYVAASEGRAVYPACDDPYLGRTDPALREIAFELAGNDLHVEKFEGAQIAYNMARYLIKGIRNDQNFKHCSVRTTRSEDPILQRNPQAALVYVARVAAPEL